MKTEHTIITPFYIFFIIMGTCGVVILPVINFFLKFNEKLYDFCFDLSWTVGAVIAQGYLLIVLKNYLSNSLSDKILYYFLTIIFTCLIIFPFLK